ncbi:hypothetical protein N2152v2_010008 [Parachlorella kessleri]
MTVTFATGHRKESHSLSHPNPQEEQHHTSVAGLGSFKHRYLSTTDLSQLDVGGSDDLDADREKKIQERIEQLYVDAEREKLAGGERLLLPDVLDISATLNDAAAAIVDDSFLRCFKSLLDEPWNWNPYLFVLWCIGVFVRNFILFPIRLLCLLAGFIIFMVAFSLVGLICQGHRRAHWERWLVQFMCKVFVFSWTGVIRYHGPKPVPRANYVWVANHTSMIDYPVLCAFSPFAAIMQLHPGWVGAVQKRYLNALGCLWFNRTEPFAQAKDRQLVQERMKAHVRNPDSAPLLIFPEGTCVNNEYCVMFKRGAFDLGATVCPIAIKYNKIFVDAFWNSKRQSFTAHLFKIMRSWALVCDVHFLEPQTRRPDESAQQFAERVQRLIAERARLKVAPWDGYLKYYNLGEKHPDLIEKRRKVYADLVRPYATAPSPKAPRLATLGSPTAAGNGAAANGSSK